MPRPSVTVAVAVVLAAAAHSCARPATPRATPTVPGADLAPAAVASAAAAATPPGLRLPTTLVARRYDARLAIDPAAPRFTGELTLEATLTAPAAVLWLDAERLHVSAATIAGADGAPVAAEVLAPPAAPGGPGARLGLRLATPLAAGPVTVHLTYDAPFEQVDSYGAFVQTVGADRYAFTQLEPLAARRVFPCLDEPSSKVPWRLTLDVPIGLAALANAPVDHEVALDAGHRRVVFAETRPLPSYLIAFAVGPFELVDAGATPGGAPIRVATFRGQAARAAFAVTSTARIVAGLEAYLGVPYPYAKLDLVPLPYATSFGAMENAGLITVVADGLLHDPRDLTEAGRRDHVRLLGHELAHQWFGDLVTMAWWDDLWLNETFATWMQEKVVAAYEPRWIDAAAPVAERAWALAADGLVSARRIRQPIAARDDIDGAFDAITYQKGAAVVRMVEAWVGAEVFRAGVHAYLVAFADGTARSADFVAAIDQASPLDVAPVLDGLIAQAGAPRLAATLTCSTGAAPTVALRQDRWLPRGAIAPPGPPPRWRLPVCIVAGDGRHTTRSCGVLDGERGAIALAGACPTWFLPDADGTGYFRAALTADAVAAVRAHGWAQLAVAERLAFADAVAAMVDRGELPFAAELDLVPALVADGAPLLLAHAAATAARALDVAAEPTRPAVEAWIRATFGARARKLGWLPGPRPDLVADQARATLVALVASGAKDGVLLDRAVTLAKDWRALPRGVRGAVLAAAVRRSAAIRERLVAELPTVADPVERATIIEALGEIEDPAAAQRALAQLLDPRVELAQGIDLIAGLGDRRTHAVAVAFLRDHFAELRPRLAEQTVVELVEPLVATCDLTEREGARAWAEAHLASEPGGPQVIAQAFEAMAQCAAQRAALGPELDAWLAARASTRP